MPLFEEYREALKSEIADMINSPGRPAGAITAAMFLKEFIGNMPWAHLDIAGTAWAEEPRRGPPRARPASWSARSSKSPHRRQQLAVIQNLPPRRRSLPRSSRSSEEPAANIDMIQVAVAAFGLTGVIMASAAVAGLLAGVLFIWYRRRRAVSTIEARGYEHNFFRPR